MNPLSATLARSPELFPHGLEPASDSLTLLRLSEADYSKASFLDARIVGPQTSTRILPFSEVEEAVDEMGLAEGCDFIFHIGHVGSTLLSRLLGAHPDVFSLREPAILRTLAQIRAEPQALRWTDAAFEAHLSTLLKLWSRTFRPGQRALVKATSFTSQLAAEILARESAPKGIFMFVPPETFLASILGAENSPKEARMLAPLRATRLNRRLASAFRAEALSMGEIVAMGWACEMTALAAAPQDRVHWLNFNDFLDSPASSLAACFRHLAIAVTDAQVQTIASSPHMRRYSKAQEFDYDAKLRGDVLAQARALCGGEIKRGLDWLHSAARQFPAIGAALERV